MNSNNQNTQDYCNLQTDQTGNISNMNLNTLHVNTINSTTLAPHNIIFEFYYHLPNDARIYRVTYSELNPSENVQLLNNGINRIPDYLLTHHYNVQSQIQQQIQQQVQHSIIYQQNSIQQQSFDTTQPIPQVYSTSDTYNAAVNGTVSYDMQDMGDTGFQNSS
ncbi:14376_t:CDS:2 [Rhizophagus irregularis]|nr:14376_t:CDS:2 [Rhizophagus irregularis]